MAAILEVTDTDAISKLGEQVEAALQEYKAHQEDPPPTPKELRKTFEKLSKRHRELNEMLKQLGERERQILDDASLDFPEVRLTRDGRFGMSEALTALKKMGILFRTAQRYLPPAPHGPVANNARWYLVWRLGAIYSKVTGQFPSRRYNAHKGREYGPFRDFVVTAHQAIGFDDPERGTNDVIREVWGGMGKKRRS